MATLDRLDAGIMREMMRGNVRNLLLLEGGDLRSSFRTIAKSLNVDQGTVRNRIRKMKEDGLITGWHLEVNPMLYGRKLECLMLDVDVDKNDKREVVRRVSSVRNVIKICNYMGPPLHVLISGQDERDLASTSQEILGVSGSGNPVWVQRPTTPIRGQLKGVDWEIIGALQEDPWKPYEEIAKEVHASSKTTRKRAANLAEEGVVQLALDVDPAAFKGIIPASLIVFYSSPEVKKEVDRRIIEYTKGDLFYAELSDPRIGVFAVGFPNAAKLQEVGDWVRRQRGVADCRPLVLLEVINISDLGVAKAKKMLSSSTQVPKQGPRSRIARAE